MLNYTKTTNMSYDLHVLSLMWCMGLVDKSARCLLTECCMRRVYGGSFVFWINCPVWSTRSTLSL